MPYTKAGKFEEINTASADAKRHVAYVWEGENPPFVDDIQLIEDHDGTFAISCTLRQDPENIRQSQTYQMTLQAAMQKIQGIELEIDSDKDTSGRPMPMLIFSTKSYETFKEIFKILKSHLPISATQPSETDRGRRDRDRMQVETVNRDRDRSPPRGYLAIQKDSIQDIKGIIESISAELEHIDIDKTTEMLGMMGISSTQPKKK